MLHACLPSAHQGMKMGRLSPVVIPDIFNRESRGLFPYNDPGFLLSQE